MQICREKSQKSLDENQHKNVKFSDSDDAAGSIENSISPTLPQKRR